MSAFLRAEQIAVSVRKNGHSLLKPFDFELEQGRSLCILGETGAGKSLLAQAILGNLSPELKASGKLWLENQDLLSMPPQKRRKLWGKTISLLPQEPMLSLDPTMKAVDQLEETYRFVQNISSPQAKQKSRKDFSDLGLKNSENHFPKELSGGMAQRLAFACAIVGQAKILLVDEPTKGLDAQYCNEIVQTLLRFQASNAILIVITHDINVAKQIDAQTIVMKNGEVLENAPAKNIFSAPQSFYAKELIDAIPSNWEKPPALHIDENQILIETKNIAKQRGGKSLFSNFSLQIKKGEILGVFGPSGCGKSTLGDLLLGLIKPDQGTIHYDANQVKKYSFLKLYQDPSATISPFFPLKTLLKDLIRLHKIDEKRVSDLKEKLNLDSDVLERCSDAVSGGELQRFAILRCLLLNPLFLFADEPTSRLDPITQKETMVILRDLVCEENCTLFLVSHDYDMLSNFCNRIVSL